MEIKILGSGCRNCQKLYDNTKSAIEELNIEGNILKVTDFMEIAKYKVMRMPALVVDEKIITSGMVPSKEKIIELLTK